MNGETEDLVNHPAHYTFGGVECIEAIEAMLTRDEYIGFLRGQVMKYVWRAGHKGEAKQDIEKALWYGKRLDAYLEEMQAPDIDLRWTFDPEGGVTEHAAADPEAWLRLGGMKERAVRAEQAALRGATSRVYDIDGNLTLSYDDTIDWSQAPVWASYLALDTPETEHTGAPAYWFESLPSYDRQEGFWQAQESYKVAYAKAYSDMIGGPRLYKRLGS